MAMAAGCSTTPSNAGLAHTAKLHGAEASQSEEEKSVAIVASLLQLLPKLGARPPPQDTAAANAPGSGVHRVRTLARFRACDAGGGEKVARAVELLLRYQVRVWSKRRDALLCKTCWHLQKKVAAVEEELDDDEDEDEDAAEVRKGCTGALNAGVYARVAVSRSLLHARSCATSIASTGASTLSSASH